MGVSATCPGCGKRVSGPDSAAGHKAKCPKCGQVIQFPPAEGTDDLAGAVKATGARPSPRDLAQALKASPAKPATAAKPAPARLPPEEEIAEAEPATPTEKEAITPTPSRAGLGSRRSSTTMSRMLVKSSPYKTLRLLAVIIFGTGVAVSVLLLLGGLAGLILLAMSGSPGLAVVSFVGGLVLAVVVFVVGKTVSEVVRLWADIGDRVRHVSLMVEDTVAQRGPNGL